MEMVLQVPYGIGYTLGGVWRQRHLESGISGGLGMTGEGNLLVAVHWDSPRLRFKDPNLL